MRKLAHNLGRIWEAATALTCHPVLSARLLSQLSRTIRGFNYSKTWRSGFPQPADSQPVGGTAQNPLRAFCEARKSGHGIWKWTHYFDVYDRHFRRFVDKDVHVLEIGIYSGGSLDMWHDYFGAECSLYGVDIEEDCKTYERDSTRVFIGDQADRSFWRGFKEEVPQVDIVIDDGGHDTEQQIVTLEEMLPHLRPGGVYVCEDIHGPHKGFAAYMQGLVNNLNRTYPRGADASPGECSEFHRWIEAIHFYPYVTVVEKALAPRNALSDERYGTEWQPFGAKRQAA